MQLAVAIVDAAVAHTLVFLAVTVCGMCCQHWLVHKHTTEHM
jgi:hypothetical protein